jgi:2-polyprenyl-3-methyl-5-hydroxy-6-metoxy-1,4-benzoquinol methylase
VHRDKAIEVLEVMLANIQSKGTAFHLGEFNVNYYRYLETLEILIKNVPIGCRVLEIGCYLGYLTLSMHKIGYEICGIDFDLYQFAEEATKQEIQLKKCDLNKDVIPFGEDEFDAIVFTEVLEHLNYWRLNAVFGEIRRVLKPGGILILSTPNLACLENRIFLLIGGIRYLGGGIIPPAHAREYTLQEVIQFVHNNGLGSKSFFYSMARDIITQPVVRERIGTAKLRREYASRQHVLKGFVIHPNWINIGRAISFPLKKLVPSFRTTMFVVAQKPDKPAASRTQKAR